MKAGAAARVAPPAIDPMNIKHIAVEQVRGVIG
jgi:hypothetical protein